MRELRSFDLDELVEDRRRAISQLNRLEGDVVASEVNGAKGDKVVPHTCGLEGDAARTAPRASHAEAWVACVREDRVVNECCRVVDGGA